MANPIELILDQLAECMILGDLRQPETVTQAIDCLRRIEEHLQEDQLVKINQTAIGLLGRIQSGGSEIEDSLIAKVTHTIQGLQKVLAHGYEVEEHFSESEYAVPLDEEAFEGSSSVDSAEVQEAATLEGDPELVGDFVGESKDGLEQVDQYLLDLEGDSKDLESLNAIFRVFHTVKGVAGFLGLTVVEKFAHAAESMLEPVRKGDRECSQVILDLTFEANDQLKELISKVEESLTTQEPWIPQESLEETFKKIESLEGSPLIQDSAVNANSDEKSRAKEAVKEIEVQLEDTEKPKQNSSNEAPEKSETEKVSKPKKKVKIQEMIKVGADRLDNLVDTIGELVICDSMLKDSTLHFRNDPESLKSVCIQFQKITRNLQQMATSLRMLPVGPTFNRMARLSRDVAKKLNKEINFVTEGDDTELDKTVVDMIADPLVHLIRNAVDHGLEDTADEREAHGKSRAGRVTLRAFHVGGNICIEVEDDGAGVHHEAVIKKAVEQGVITTGEGLSDQDVLNLLFHPGMSTAKELSDISGRGVGLDVVKRNIEALRGRIEVHSEIGVGTTFSIKLPLTLAIIEGMVVRVGTQRFIIPTLSIVRMIRPEEHRLCSVMSEDQVIQIQDELIPLHRIDLPFSIKDALKDPEKVTFVIIEGDEGKYAIAIDQLLGQQQIIIKNIGEYLKDTPGIAGGTILPDGTVGLILDTSNLPRIVQDFRAQGEESEEELRKRQGQEVLGSQVDTQDLVLN